MKPIFFSTERGQALILISLAAIGLFAIVGLAVDGTAKFSDRRHAQNAADTAALAGSLSLLRPGGTTPVSGGRQQWQVDALLRAESNGYDRNLITNQVWVYNCHDPKNVPGTLRYDSPVDCGPAYEGNPNYVQVVITSNVNTFFARVIGINQTHNTVQAISMAQQAYSSQLYGGASIVGLAPDECKTIWLSGSALVNVTGGGIFSNSNKNCGVTVQGGTGFNISMTGSISMVASSYTKNGNPPLGGIAGGFAGGATPYEYPPPEDTLPTYTCDYTYANFPPSGVSSLSPGTYCVTNKFKLNSGDTLTGSGVTIVMQSGDIDWNGNATLDISAPTTGKLAGMLIYAPMSNNKTMKFNGNSATKLKGTIFMPAAPIVYNGNGNLNPSHVQIIGYTVEITGSNITNVIYQDPDNWDETHAPKVGIMQ